MFVRAAYRSRRHCLQDHSAAMCTPFACRKRGGSARTLSLGHERALSRLVHR